MKILITGGAGFIGFHLARFYANKNNQVTLVDNLYRGNMDDDLKHLIGKINVKFINKDLTRKIDNLSDSYNLVFHLAGINGTSNFYDSPYFTSKTNLLSLINMIDWVKKYSPGARFIWTSSSETYGCNVHKTIPTGEDVMLCIDDVFNPRWSYASSKIAGESMVLNCGLSSIVVRPHNVYGPRMGVNLVIPDFIMKLQKVKESYCKSLEIEGNGLETRTFCYIDDFVKGINLVSRVGDVSEIYNVASDTGEIAMLDLARKMMKLFDVDVPVVHIAERKGSTKRRCADITKLKQLGFVPQINLDEGLQKTIRWYS